MEGRLEDGENAPLLQATRVSVVDQHEAYAGHRGHKLHPTPSIYSGIIFAPAILRIKEGKGLLFNNASKTMFLLLVANVVLQIGLLKVMSLYSHIYSVSTRAYQEGKYETPQASFLTPHERDLVQDAKTDPLCRGEKGDYICMPPSIHFASEWKSLDVNNDGVWNASEAFAAGKDGNAALARRRAIFFRTILKGFTFQAQWLETQNYSFYLSPQILEGHAIPKAYFEYWVGDAMMCTRFESSACEHIVASGLFEASLLKGHLAASHKGIVDYTSAVAYCRMMLEDHGGCEHSLPADWKAALLRRRNMCGALKLSPDGVVVNPRDKDEIISVSEPSYTILSKQINAYSGIFTFFVILIIYLFYASMVDELREILCCIDLILFFPSVYGPNDSGGIDFGPQVKQTDSKMYQFVIERISKKHRIYIAVVLFLRIGILAYILSFGNWFLLKEDRFMELVLNAVALAFITGIDEMLYDVFVEHQMKKEELAYDSVQPIQFHGIFPGSHSVSFAGTLYRREIWGLFIVPLLSVIVVLSWQYFERGPYIEALKCACLQEGENCAESMVNQAGWWQQYWTHRLPAAIHHIEAMRLQGI